MDINRNDRDDIEFEIKFYEGVLEKKGDFYQALTALGDLYTKSGMIEKGLDVDQRLAKIRPQDPIVLYNLSCSYSLLGMIDEAFEAMKFSIEQGYRDFSYLEKDSDLNNLLRDENFQRYLSQVKREKKGKGQTDYL